MVGRFNVALCAAAPLILAGACISSTGTSQDSAGAESGSDDQGGSGDQGSDSLATQYRVTELVTNETDPDLVNPWGIVGREGLFWIADEVTGRVSIYDGNGRPSEEYPRGRFAPGEGITGVAALASEDEGSGAESESFLINTSPSGCTPELSPAEFVFANMNGTLIAINDDAPVSGVTVVDRSDVGAVYLGVAKIDRESGPVLLAADFANGRIDVFDDQFKLITSPTGAQPFVDPSVPEGFGPFNVLALENKVYVAYAKQSEDEPGEEEAGPGLGQVSIFDADGTLQASIKSDLFNAPWGMTLTGDNGESCTTPGHQQLLVGNFGDGHITAFDAASLRPLGQLTDENGSVIVIDGLWGITAGSEDAGDENAIYFVAGPEDETAGVFGRLDPVTN